MTEEVRKKQLEKLARQTCGLLQLGDHIQGPNTTVAVMSEAFVTAYQLGVEAMREAAAELLEALANQWVGTLPSDEVASLNCKQYAAAIRKLKG